MNPGRLAVVISICLFFGMTICLEVGYRIGSYVAKKTEAAHEGTSTIQAAVDKRLSNDPNLSSLGITALVMNGKVTLMGIVKADSLKSQVEKVVRRVKGVKAVDNQISVIAG